MTYRLLWFALASYRAVEARNEPLETTEIQIELGLIFTL